MKNAIIWTPRILSILIIIFFSLFAFDVEGGTFPENLLGTLIHLLPTFFLLAGLIFGWRKPIIAAAAYFVLAVAFTVFFNTYRTTETFALISLPVLICAILYYFSSKIKN